MFVFLIFGVLVFSVHSLPMEDGPTIKANGVETTVADEKHDSNGMVSSLEDEMKKSEENINKKLEEDSPSLSFVMNTMNPDVCDEDSYGEMVIQLVPEDADEDSSSSSSSKSSSSASSSSSK